MAFPHPVWLLHYSLALWGRELLEKPSVSRYLPRYILSGYGSLFLFVSAVGGSITDDGWVRPDISKHSRAVEVILLLLFFFLNNTTWFYPSLLSYSLWILVPQAVPGSISWSGPLVKLGIGCLLSQSLDQPCLACLAGRTPGTRLHIYSFILFSSNPLGLTNHTCWWLV